jgi:hypothetical protein
MANYSGTAAPGAAPTAVKELLKPADLRAQPVEPIKPTKPKNNAPAEEKAAYEAAMAQYNTNKTAYDADLKAWKTEKSTYDTAIKDYNAALPQYEKDLAKYNADKAAFDEQVRKYGLDRAAYDQYVADYQNRIGNTNLYNQAQFSTTGANVPAFTTYSDAQKAAMGYGPAVTPTVGGGEATLPDPNSGGGVMDLAVIVYGPDGKMYSSPQAARDAGVTNWTMTPPDPNSGGTILPMPQPGPQDFAGIGQGGLNQQIQNYMGTNPSMPDLNAYMTRYGISDYDIRNAMGTGTQYGTPQWQDTIKAPIYSAPTVSSPLGVVADTLNGTNTGTTATVYDPNQTYWDDPNWVGSAAWQEWKSNNRARGGYIKSYAQGGSVKGYRPGGPVDMLYGGAGNDAMMGRPAGDRLTTPAPAPVDPMAEMRAMLDLYARPTVTSEQIAAAAERRAAEQKAFEDILRSQLQGTDSAPQSKAEMYFRLAAAFGAPTKTGHFAENLALVGETMADQLSEKAKREREAREKKLGVDLEIQKMRMGAAGEDLEALQGLQTEEAKYRRDLGKELIRDYIKSGEPQSAAGKTAMDMGLKPGTPEFNAKVTELAQLEIERQTAAINAQIASMESQQAQSKQMNATEIKLRSETEDALAGVNQSLEDLKEAYRLNPNTFAGGLYDKFVLGASELVGSDDPKVVNTRLLTNLLESQALEKLKATFGGSGITNAEREALSALQGAGAKSTEERGQIILRAYEVLQDIQARQTKKLDEILSGAYRQYKPIDGGE